MQSKATTVAAYLASLPADRRAAMQAIRAVIKMNLDPDLEEGMQYGMIGYYVPHSVFPPGYHCDPKQPLPYAGLASQKGHMSLYMMGFYVGAEPGEVGETPEGRYFRDAWTKAGKKLDMGKACVRFKKLEDVPLEVVGEAFRRLPARTYVERYVAILGEHRATRKAGGPSRKPATKKAGAARVTTKKAAAAKSAADKSSARAVTKRK
jgi:hypothetical protein